MEDNDTNNLQTEQLPGGNSPAPPDDDIYIFEDENAAGEPMGFLTRFISIFAAPGRLMENLKEFPRVGVPFLYILIIGAASSLIAMPVTRIVTSAQSIAIAERYGVDFLNSAQAMQVIEQNFALVLATAYGGVIVSALISAAFLRLMSRLMGGTAKFKHYFSLNLHRTALTLTGGILVSALMLITESPMTFTSLAPVLMPNGNSLMPVFNLLSAIELFGIWSTVLLAVGMKKLNDGFSTAKAVTAGVIWYAIGVGITVLASSSTVIMYDRLYQTMQQMR